MLTDVSRHIWGRTKGRGLRFGQLVHTHTGKCLKCQSSSDGHSDHSALCAGGYSGLLGPLQSPNSVKVYLLSTFFSSCLHWTRSGEMSSHFPDEVTSAELYQLVWSANFFLLLRFHKQQQSVPRCGVSLKRHVHLFCGFRMTLTRTQNVEKIFFHEREFSGYGQKCVKTVFDLGSPCSTGPCLCLFSTSSLA